MRVIRYFLFVILILFCVSSYASEDIVVVNLNGPQGDLGTSKNKPKEPALSKQVIPPKKTTNSTVKTVPNRITSNPTSRASSYAPKVSEKIKLGNYAVVRADISRMHASPNVNSSIRGVISFGETVIVKKEKGNFYGIILEDGISIGWVEKSDLRKSDAEVWAKDTSVKPNPPIPDLPTNGIKGYDINKIPQSNYLLYSFAYINTPYVYGGTSINRGMDCSAFVRDIFSKMYNYKLPRTAREQVLIGNDIPINQALMREGDRLYFRYKNSYIDHTGIYIGNGYYIHCNASKNGVSCDYLWSKVPSSKLVAVKRF